MNATEDYAIRLCKVSVYRNLINECEFPDEMKIILDNYLKNGDVELEEVIESQYKIGAIKEANFRAGCMYQEMIMPLGRIRQFCIKHGIKWSFTKFCTILLCLVILAVYQGNFRYKYRTYKDHVGRVQVVRVDRLTGNSIFYYPKYVEQKEK